MIQDTLEPVPVRIAFLRLALGFVAYDEIMGAIADSLRQAGATVRLIESALECDPATDDALLIVGAPGYYPHLRPALHTLRGSHGANLRVIFWQLEHVLDPEMNAVTVWAHVAKSLLRAARRGGQLDTMRGASFLLLRQWTNSGLLDDVLVFARRGAEFLARHGVPARYVPLGHHPIWGVNFNGERDIDVLFLGEVLDDRRSRIVRAVRDELAAAGVTLSTMYDFNPVGVWGDERNALLNRTKIYLSVYRHPSASSGLRFSLGMGNGALVVSEPVADPAPFVAGEHFVEAPVPRLAQTILAYLRDDDARQRICRAAAHQLQTQYHMADSAAQIIALVRAAKP